MAPADRRSRDDARLYGTEGDGRTYADESTELTFSFGQYRLHPRQQLLLKGADSVPLGGRAFEILLALVECAGELVEKDTLIARAWPGLTVEESNLRAQINAVRRALAEGLAGEKCVVTVPGRGYRFVVPVVRSTGEIAQPSQAAASRGHNFPDGLTRPIGRADIVAMVSSRLRRGRFVTIVGPAGIGKTTVALAVADQLISSYKHGAQFVDLTPLGDARLVPTALASTLGVAVRSETPLPALTSFLKDKEMLILLDNCEHVVLAAAAFAEDLLKAAPGIQVLATSREPLRAEHEHVQRLPPLETAPPTARLTAAEALRYPALQLFVERAAAGAGGYEFRDEDVPVVAQICRRLDGIALAIELAAGRVDAFGVRGVASRLDDRFHLLTRGRRTALPRHQTLRAAFDWSYELLSPTERTVMRRLGLFANRFTMDAASAVAGDTTITASEVDEIVADLVEKSLVMSDVGSMVVYYRLTDTARAYALNRLTEDGETQAVARRHALYQLDCFRRAHLNWETWTTTEWLSTNAPQIDDLRSALDWAFSAGGDVGIGVALTVAAVPLWFEMSLMEECCTRAERALSALEGSKVSDDRSRMHLYAAVAWSQAYTTGSPRDTGSAWNTTYEIAETLDDTDYRLRALWGIWTSRVYRGEFGEALVLAKRFCSVAEKAADINDRLLGDRLTGVALHFLGDQSNARQHIERMLASYVVPTRRSDAVRFQFDQRITARITLSRVLWLQGFADQALRCVEINLGDALSMNHKLSVCNALAQAACPIAFLAGDLLAAEHYTKMLLDQTASDEPNIWRAYARCLEGELNVKRGNISSGLQQLGTAIDELRRVRFFHYLTTFLGALAEGLAVAGDTRLARAKIDEAVERSDQSDERWYRPELLRIRGITTLRTGGDAAVSEAEADFLESINLARTQEALAWELRTTTSLARLRREQGRIDEAYEVLCPVYSRFSEGYDTHDLKVAKNLLDDLLGHR
jgi:predicted ATPase/DNA-binding winged helix-turn-helix (wHTH) protein